MNHGGLCCSYGKETARRVLSRSSAHSKLAILGVVRSPIGNALKKSCFQCVGNALGSQINSLKSTGYSLELISLSVREQLLGAFQHIEKVQKKNIAVAPYFHDLSHCLMALGAKFDVNVVFRLDFRLSKPTPVKNKNPSVSCVTKVVQKVLLDFGLCHVRQTGLCVNYRLT